MSAMLSETDKKKQLDSFNEILKESIRNKGSSIIPVDLKGDYVHFINIINNPTFQRIKGSIIVSL